MLLGRNILALGCELSQTTTNAEARVTWFDDIINITILGSLIWIGKRLGVIFLLFSKECLDISTFFFDFLRFLTAEYCYGAACTHYSNLG